MQAVLKIHTLFLVFFDTKKYNGSCQRCRMATIWLIPKDIEKLCDRRMKDGN